MAEPKGDKLYVNLGASQARRRLKGIGHGVRKVQSAGRNQAVIIHTATGRHLEELQAQFADVGFASTQSALSAPIENLPSIGPRSASWLRDVGISTLADLRRIGPVDAYRLVKQRQPKVSLNLLWALTAALLDERAELLTEEKESMRREVGQD